MNKKRRERETDTHAHREREQRQFREIAATESADADCFAGLAFSSVLLLRVYLYTNSPDYWHSGLGRKRKFNVTWLDTLPLCSFVL